MAGSKKSSPGKARSAGTGQYVKPGYAAKHPDKTVIERDKPSKPSKPKR
jgi:hypothetical protein